MSCMPDGRRSPRKAAGLAEAAVLRFLPSVRPLPGGLHRTWDTFYRKLILLAFHPGGAERAAHHCPPVLEAAISRIEFCRPFR
jgi:hypothetical protein